MKIIVEESPLYSGEFPFDPYAMTMRERHRVKEICGMSGMQVMEGLLVEDTDLMVALAAVAIERAKGACDVNQLWDQEGLKIRLDFTEEARAADARPPERSASESDSSSEG